MKKKKFAPRGESNSRVVSTDNHETHEREKTISTFYLLRFGPLTGLMVEEFTTYPCGPKFLLTSELCNCVCGPMPLYAVTEGAIALSPALRRLHKVMS